ncbi:MAG: Dam family site-specific DNA-(adenine-N6)-methyltransferase [Paludibacteraceae bacterium]|nr:Dam family site-specific DNA-(adenine-N6)-methyltransferase [Paludibacteraceae bacterium]
MKAKPFIKWVGGKTQLIEQLEALLPTDFDKWENVTYIEPFVGGGAMLFYMLQTHSNITKAVINDINPDLTMCYQVVRDKPDQLIKELKVIQAEYYALPTTEERLTYYLQKREEYNTKQLAPVRNTALFFFLNRTCFNGLYRVNKKGLFNVSFGKQDKPMICDPTTIYADSELLKKVTICTGDYQQTITNAQGKTLFYFDPPYRPLNATSNFNNYAKEAFNDDAQIRLKQFCDNVNEKGFAFMLSNADCSGANPNDTFFEDLYLSNPRYNMQRVYASRNINSVASKRGKLTEIVVRNYEANKKTNLSLFE